MFISHGYCLDDLKMFSNFKGLPIQQKNSKFTMDKDQRGVCFDFSFKSL